MTKSTRRSWFRVGLVGVIVGVGLTLAAEQVDRVTSTDAFCGNSCHSMNTYIANDEVYLASSHRTSATGVIAGCANCHMPKGLVPATWEHISAGIKDIISENSHDFTDAGVWASKRTDLAHGVRDKMLANDSANCRACHEMSKIAVAGEEGQRAHARAGAEAKTCIQCHINIVHTPVPARPEFLQRRVGG